MAFIEIRKYSNQDACLKVDGRHFEMLIIEEACGRFQGAVWNIVNSDDGLDDFSPDFSSKILGRCCVSDQKDQ